MAFKSGAAGPVRRGRPNLRRSTWRSLLTEAALAGLAAWFAVVVATALPTLRPRATQPQLPTSNDSYLDDFAVFYTAGSLLRQGRGADVYDVDALHTAEGRTFVIVPERFEALPYFNPPHTLLLFAPLSWLSLPVAAVVWLLATLLLAATGIRLLLRTYPAPLGRLAGLCLALGAISSLPFYQTLVHGQMSFLLLFGLCLVYVSMRTRRAAASVTGLLILAFKPQLLILPLLLFALQRRWRELAIAGAAGLVLTLAALALLGPHALGDYMRISADSTSWENENGISTFGMFGWVGIVSGLTGSAASPGARLAVAILDLGTLGLVAYALGRGRKRATDPALLLSVAVTAGLLISPHFYAQDLLLLLPVLWLLYASAPGERWLVAVAAAGGWFIAYGHFAILSATHLNLTTVFMLALLALLLSRCRQPAAVSTVEGATKAGERLQSG